MNPEQVGNTPCNVLGMQHTTHVDFNKTCVGMCKCNHIPFLSRTVMCDKFHNSTICGMGGSFAPTMQNGV